DQARHRGSFDEEDRFEVGVRGTRKVMEHPECTPLGRREPFAAIELLELPTHGRVDDLQQSAGWAASPVPGDGILMETHAGSVPGRRRRRLRSQTTRPKKTSHWAGMSAAKA